MAIVGQGCSQACAHRNSAGLFEEASVKLKDVIGKNELEQVQEKDEFRVQPESLHKRTDGLAVGDVGVEGFNVHADQCGAPG